MFSKHHLTKTEKSTVWSIQPSTERWPRFRDRPAAPKPGDAGLDWGPQRRRENFSHLWGWRSYNHRTSDGWVPWNHSQFRWTMSDSRSFPVPLIQLWNAALRYIPEPQAHSFRMWGRLGVAPRENSGGTSPKQLETLSTIQWHIWNQSTTSGT